jgi:hypothetical protein
MSWGFSLAAYLCEFTTAIGDGLGHAFDSSACAAVAPAATFKFEAYHQTERKSAPCTFDKVHPCTCCRFDRANGTSFCIIRAAFCTSHASSSTGCASWTSDAKQRAANTDARLFGGAEHPERRKFAFQFELDRREGGPAMRRASLPRRLRWPARPFQ